MMTLEQKKQLLFFEAELYESYAAKIKQVKEVLQAFDGKQVNCRINEAIAAAIPSNDSLVWVEKSGHDDLRIWFSSKVRYIDVGTKGNRNLVYAENEKTSFLCVGAIKNGRLDYWVASSMINENIATWLSDAESYRKTDYSALFSRYMKIADDINHFKDSENRRICDLLHLEFEIKYRSY